MYRLTKDIYQNYQGDYQYNSLTLNKNVENTENHIYKIRNKIIIEIIKKTEK